MQVMNFSSAECKNCYKCVRTCSVKAIRIKDARAQIVEDRCIECGHCLVVCPQNARDVKSHLDNVHEAIEENKKVVVSLAPSYRGYFEQSDKFIAGLKKLGFSSIEETSIGAEMVSNEYEKYIQNNTETEFITTCCPSSVMLIEKYYPELIKYMIPIVSPMVAHAKQIKARDKDAFVVFIGPCISKISEGLSEKNENVVDAVLTFDEVTHAFANANITYELLEGEMVDEVGTLRGDKYPLVGGVLGAIRPTLDQRELQLLRIHGMEKSKIALEALKKGELKNVCIEINICNESCMDGPGGTNQPGNVFTRVQALQKYARENIVQKEREETRKYTIDCSRTFMDRSPNRYEPMEQEIIDVLHSMGKNTKSDELNCGSCGYNTCREKAVAVLNHMSEIDMCMPYTKSIAEKLSNEIFTHSPNAILIINNKMEIVDLNPMSEDMFHCNLQDIVGKPINTLLDDSFLKTLIREKRCSGKEKMILENYHLIVERYIIYLEKQDALLIIFSDITGEEERKQELVSLKQNMVDVTQTIIDKQMRTAQEIASLLGETTAETKVAITKLKQVLQQEGDF